MTYSGIGLVWLEVNGLSNLIVYMAVSVGTRKRSNGSRFPLDPHNPYQLPSTMTQHVLGGSMTSPILPPDLQESLVGCSS